MALPDIAASMAGSIVVAPCLVGRVACILLVELERAAARPATLLVSDIVD